MNKSISFAASCAAATILAFTAPAFADQHGKPEGTVSFIDAQQNQELRVAKWIGATVKNKAGETVGDINDLVLDKDLKVVAVVIGVGGFLGLAEKNVAVPVDAVNMSVSKENARVAVVNVTKDALKNAPDYKYANDKTLRERLGEAREAVGETYDKAKKAVEEGYSQTKEAVSDAMSDDNDNKDDKEAQQDGSQ